MDDLQIYDDLIQIDVIKYKERIDGLELHINKLNADIQALCSKLLEMRETQTSLVTNISALYKTAKNEIERKDRMIAQLRKEKDEILFRKGVYALNKRPHSPSKQFQSKKSRSDNQNEHFAEVTFKENPLSTPAKTFEDNEGPKFNDVIEQTKEIKINETKSDVKSSPRSSKEKELQKKKHEHRTESRASRKEKTQVSPSNSKDKEHLISIIYKSVDIVNNMHNKGTKSPKKLTSSRRSNNDKERSKSKQENLKKSSSKERTKSPKTNRSNSGHTNTKTNWNRSRKEHERASSKSCNDKYNKRDSKSSNDLRKKLQQSKHVPKKDQPKERSASFDKDCLVKLIENDKKPKERSTSSNKDCMVKLIETDKKTKERTDSSDKDCLMKLIRNDKKPKERSASCNKESMVKLIEPDKKLKERSASSNKECMVKLIETDKKPKERSAFSDKDCMVKLIENDKPSLTDTNKTLCRNQVPIKSAEDMEEGEITDESIEACESKVSEPKPKAKADTQTDESVSTVKLETTKTERSEVSYLQSEVNSGPPDLKPILYLTDIIKDADMSCGNFAETKINDDNIVELHIHPKSYANEASEKQIDSLLSELEGNSALKTPVVINSDTGSGGVCSNNSIVGQNNENVNTSNNLDVTKTEKKITSISANTSLNNSSSNRRRRRTYFVSIT